MPAAPTESRHSTATTELDGLLESWRRHLRAQRISPATIATYSTAVGQLTRFLEAQGMPLAPAAVRREHVEAFITDILAHWKPATAHNRYRGCHAFFRWLVEEGEIRTNPMERMKPPRLPEEPPPVLREAELRALLAACERDKTFAGRRDEAVLRIFMDTGARRGEVLNLGVADLDLEQGLLRVTGKGSRTRQVPLGAQTVRAVDRYLRWRAKHPRSDLAALWIGKKEHLTQYGLAALVRGRWPASQDCGAASTPTCSVHAYAHIMLAGGLQETDLWPSSGGGAEGCVARYQATSTRGRAGDRGRAPPRPRGSPGPLAERSSRPAHRRPAVINIPGEPSRLDRWNLAAFWYEGARAARAEACGHAWRTWVARPDRSAGVEPPSMRVAPTVKALPGSHVAPRRSSPCHGGAHADIRRPSPPPGSLVVVVRRDASSRSSAPPPARRLSPRARRRYRPASGSSSIAEDRRRGKPLVCPARGGSRGNASEVARAKERGAAFWAVWPRVSAGGELGGVARGARGARCSGIAGCPEPGMDTSQRGGSGPGRRTPVGWVVLPVRSAFSRGWAGHPAHHGDPRCPGRGGGMTVTRVILQVRQVGLGTIGRRVASLVTQASRLHQRASFRTGARVPEVAGRASSFGRRVSRGEHRDGGGGRGRRGPRA